MLGILFFILFVFASCSIAFGSANSSPSEAPEPAAPVVPAEPVAPPEPAAPPVTTTGGLEAGYAMAYCDMYGAANHRYGYTLHYIVGLLAAEYQPEHDRWYIKAESTVKNEYGTKVRTNTECYVTGSNDNPQVVDFIIY